MWFIIYITVYSTQRLPCKVNWMISYTIYNSVHQSGMKIVQSEVWILQCMIIFLPYLPIIENCFDTNKKELCILPSLLCNIYVDWKLRQDLLLSNDIHTVAYHQHNKTVNPLASYQNVKIGHKELDLVLIMFCKDVL